MRCHPTFVLISLLFAGAVVAQTARSTAPSTTATPTTTATPSTEPATTQADAPIPIPVWSRTRETGDTPPPLDREFRGVWVSSVNNGTWPPKAGMTAADQQTEAIRQLDRAVELKFNAVIFQVRPAADALYESDLEPWSEYLSGTQGQDPGYDPLKFWIDEAHKRGLELHAWLNPYRAKHANSKSTIARDHISVTHPEIVRKYGGYLWLDPGEPLAARHSMAVFLDVVKRYDLDGVHMDDYFYPYQVTDEKTKALIDFPDNSSWAKYQRSGGKLARNDWRRDNVNQFIKQLYERTKKMKPHVKVGIAPFGIWRPDHPPGIKGLDQYDALYADAKLWLNEGWLDYFSPQLYWKIGGPQSFPKLLDWWLSENPKCRHVWPGQSVGRYIPKDGSLSMEVPNQLAFIRDRAPEGSTGFIFWPLGAVLKESSLVERLKAVEFADPAIVPLSPWLDDKNPPKPIATVKRGDGEQLEISVKAPRGDRDPNNAAWQWAVQYRAEDGWYQAVFPAHLDKVQIPSASAVAVYTIDRNGNASDAESPKMPPAR